MPVSSQHFMCIYSTPEGLCPGGGKPSLEHHLPAGAGEFRDYVPLLNRVCHVCNARFGGLDDVVLRNSPEAVRRKQLGVDGRASHSKENILLRPHFGLPPARLLGPQPRSGINVLWDPTSTAGAQELRQLVFQKPSSETVPIPLPLTVVDQAGLEELMDRYRIDRSWPLILFIGSDEADNKFIQTLCQGLIGERQVEFKTGADVGDRIDVDIGVVVSPMYFRGLVKIAFHYFLVAFPNLSGREPEFDDVKRFVFDGTGSHETFVSLYHPAQFPIVNRTGHLLAAVAEEARAFVRMQLFAVPGVPSHVVQVELSRRSLSGRATGVVARAFLYFSEKQGKYDGEMVSVRVDRGRDRTGLPAQFSEDPG